MTLLYGMLKEQEAGGKTADVCRKHGLFSAGPLPVLWTSR